MTEPRHATILQPNDGVVRETFRREANRETSPSRARPRAVELLIKILASGDTEISDIAAALMVPATTVAAYLSGRRAMSLEHQLLLAAFAIERTPKHARLGHRLRGQVRAAIAFAVRETPTHDTPPPPRRW